MTKLLSFIIMLLLFTSCKRHEQIDRIEFKYSAYSFHLNQEKWEMEFYLAWHFSIDDEGNYKIMKHDTFMNKARYFKGVINSKLKNEIGSLVVNINNSKRIIIRDTPLLVYDGFDYCLDYKIAENNRTKIQYINAKERCPENIIILTRKLDALIINTNRKENEIDSFSLGAYIDTLKRISSFYEAMPPKKAPPQPLNQIKFIPPKSRS